MGHLPDRLKHRIPPARDGIATGPPKSGASEKRGLRKAGPPTAGIISGRAEHLLKLSQHVFDLALAPNALQLFALIHPVVDFGLR